MQITSFTASRRVGFTLPENVRDAVNRMTDACQYGIRHPTLADALEEVSGVTYVVPNDMSDAGGPIFVDIGAGTHADAEQQVLEILKVYATAAVSVDILAPDLLNSRAGDFWREASDLLFVHDEFVLSSADGGATVSVHHLRNGVPCRVTVEEDGLLGIIAELDQRKVEDWAHEKVPLLGKKTTGTDPDALMAGHALERLVPVGRLGLYGSSIAYLDRDLVVVADRSRRVVVHFRRDGRYSLKILHGDEADELLELADIRGLDPDDDGNPVRDFVRTVADFDLIVPEMELEDREQRQFAP